MGATEVTPAAEATTAMRAEPVVRLFAVTLLPPKAVSIITISGRDYQRDENLNFSWVFDYAHQSTIAGSFEVSAAPIRCGKGAQDG
ncbi:hypothetical protein [Mycobacterium sp. 94-17]|uniref:hypothetical protein n=1 Tax=Mycobacterium sp. 94-17 TaxID=2986147 RepID=UPI002D1F4274|nr:hypothetical protein [Mycobacterium sp. 94-17]MEB4211687.1 hypothetical protein [Mycobacterium sp. 94-17]